MLSLVVVSISPVTSQPCLLRSPRPRRSTPHRWQAPPHPLLAAICGPLPGLNSYRARPEASQYPAICALDSPYWACWRWWHSPRGQRRGSWRATALITCNEPGNHGLANSCTIPRHSHNRQYSTKKRKNEHQEIVQLTRIEGRAPTSLQVFVYGGGKATHHELTMSCLPNKQENPKSTAFSLDPWSSSNSKATHVSPNKKQTQRNGAEEAVMGVGGEDESPLEAAGETRSARGVPKD